MKMTLVWREDHEASLLLYLDSTVNSLFKILLMREQEEPTLSVYIESLQAELMGCANLLERVERDPLFIRLVSILQYLLDNPQAEVSVYKRETFKAIATCNKLKERHCHNQTTQAAKEG